MFNQTALFDPVEYAKECVRERVNNVPLEEVVYITVDINALVKITCHSASYLEQHFINTPEVKKLECSPTSKRLWKYPDIRYCWLEFCNRNNQKKQHKRGERDEALYD